MGRNEAMTELGANEMKSINSNNLEETVEKVNESNSNSKIYCLNVEESVWKSNIKTTNFGMRQCRQSKHCDTINDGMSKKREELFGSAVKRVQCMVCMALVLLIPLYTAVVVVSVVFFAPKEQDGGWSSWGSWSHCSNSQGVGLRSRHRSCNSSIPSSLGKQCLGNTEQVGLCNSQTPSQNGTMRITKNLKAHNGGLYGDWTSTEFCPLGTFASGYNMKIEEERGPLGDNTALNSIRLICTNMLGQGQYYITSGEGQFGNWRTDKSCSKQNLRQNFLVGFSLQVKPVYTSANFVKFRCRNPVESNTETELVLPPGNGLYGSWGNWSESCDARSAICGLSTNIQPDQGRFRDDTALNDVIFYCCSDE